MYNQPEFKEFPKISRLFEQDVCVTEKIDGTNALIWIGDNPNFDPDFDPQTESMLMKAGSRTRWITPEDDNYGFARWVETNKEELMKLGPGYHYGEWWGNGIQRTYNMKKKVFSLFNVGLWNDTNKPECCDVVPTIYSGVLTPEIYEDIWAMVHDPESHQDFVSPAALKYGIEFDKPEGCMMFLTKARLYFKLPIEKGSKDGKTNT